MFSNFQFSYNYLIMSSTSNISNISTSTAKKPIRMALIYQYFTRQDKNLTMARCNFCGCNYSLGPEGRTRGLKQHLRYSIYIIAWPHFWRTMLNSPPNGDFCPRIWTSWLFLWLDLRSLDPELTKIGPNFRKPTTYFKKWGYHKMVLL